MRCDDPLIVVVKFPDSDFWATFAHIFNAMAFAEIQIGGLGSLDAAQVSEIILTLADPMYFMDQGYKDLPESLDGWAAFHANLNNKPARIRNYFHLSMEVFVGKYANDILILPKCPFNYYALDTRLPEDERFIQGES